MRAKELVPILAEIFGVPFETAFMIDRSLSESGLREKGRGKRLPEMTRKEALIFLIACMTTQKATRAGEEVQPWLEARDAIIEPKPASDFMEGEDSGFGSRRYIFDKIQPLLASFKENGEADVGLVNFLLTFCHMIQNSELISYTFRLVFDLSHSWAAIEAIDPIYGPIDTYSFYISGPPGGPDVETGIYRTAYVHGEALMAIIARTDDPLEMA